MKRFKLPALDGKIFLALFVLILCIEGCFQAYRNIYMKTPDYSMRVIIAAANSGDAETVTAMVDEKNLANELFDMVATDNAMAQFPWSPLKTDFSTDLSIVWSNTITGNLDSAAFHQAKTSTDNRLKALNFPLPTAGWEYRSSTWSHVTSDGYAEITLTFYNKTLDASVPVTFSMERTGARTWHIIGFTDTAALSEKLQGAYKNKLAAYNEPIQKKLDQAVKLHNISAQLIRDTEAKQVLLRVQYTPVFNVPANNLKEAKGVYELRRKSDQAILYSGELRLALASGKDHTSQFLLNPLIPSQYAIINRNDLQDTESVIHVISITTDDGNILALAKQLPEE